MKKIIVFLVLFIFTFSYCFVGCSSTNQGQGNSVSSSSPADGNGVQNGGSASTGNSSSASQGGSSGSSSATDNPDQPNSPNDGQDAITTNDYLKNLIGTEYVNDADFINFVATMDQRTVGKVIYASNNGQGEGAIDDPASLEDAIDMAKAGDTVYLRGGEYIFKEAIWLDKGGSKGAYLTIKSYPGEKAVLTTTPENVNKYHESGEYLFFAFDDNCGYVIFEDLEIYGAQDKYVAGFACYGGGQNHLIFKNIDIHDLKTTKTSYGANAFLFMGENKNPINNIMLINNRCHDLTLGYSEAVSFAGNCEYCYVIENSVYDCTNIGIDFYGNAEYCSTESLDQTRYSVMALNTVYNCNSPYADCAGLYVDGGRNCLIEANLVYNCQYGIEIGAEELKESYPVIDIVVRNNVLKQNTVCTMRIGGYDKQKSGTVKNCLVYNNTFIDNRVDSDIIISKADGVTIANNVFSGNGLYVETEFDSTYVKNLKFLNNCFTTQGESFSIYGKEITVEALNASYGAGNIVKALTFDERYTPSIRIVGCSDYAPQYDFYLTKRKHQYIGAVE